MGLFFTLEKFRIGQPLKLLSCAINPTYNMLLSAHNIYNMRNLDRIRSAIWQ